MWTLSMLGSLGLVLWLVIVACAPKTTTVFLGEARIVGRLENGNYEVTQAWIYERARVEAELEMRLRECEEESK